VPVQETIEDAPLGTGERLVNPGHVRGGPGHHVMLADLLGYFDPIVVSGQGEKTYRDCAAGSLEFNFRTERE
jgi:hypothetical protein